MGYTHYWRRPKTLDAKTFTDFAADAKKILDYCHEQLGIHIGDAQGNGKPTCNTSKVAFNGSVAQPQGMWTTTEPVSLPWPSPMASINEPSVDPIADKTEGNWFAGTLVNQRVAPVQNLETVADGSYESVYIERCFKPYKGQTAENGLYFEFCKTAYRPYDLAVTAVLIAFKHHFPEVQISSDGEPKDWLDGKITCFNLFGYGMDFDLE